MKYLILLFLSFFLLALSATPAFSQQYEDVVYLKNGSIIHGIIIEQVPNESIKIKAKDENIFVFKMDEIEKITKEEVKTVKKEKAENDEEQTQEETPPKQTEKKGTQLAVILGLGASFGPEDLTFINFHTAIGALFSRNFGSVFVLDFNQYPAETYLYGSPSIMTFRADGLAGQFSRNEPFSAFGRFGVGYSMLVGGAKIADDASFYLGAGAGLKIVKSMPRALCFEAGYMFFASGSGLFTIRLSALGDLY